MIRTDGERSLKRAWFAKKKLAQIIGMDIPGKSLIYDGFTIGIKQQDGTGKGYVKAPMGLRVLCSKDTGIICCTTDYWLGGFTGRADMYTVDSKVPLWEIRSSVFNKWEVPFSVKNAGSNYTKGRVYEKNWGIDANGVVKSGEFFTAQDDSVITADVREYEVSRATPYMYGSPYDFIYNPYTAGYPDNFFTSPGLLYYWSASNCRPVSFPIKDSEASIFSVSLRKENNDESTRQSIAEISLHGYVANGSQLSRSGSATQYDFAYVGPCCVFNLPSPVYRSASTIQGTALNFIQVPVKTNRQVPSTIVIGPPVISFATIHDGQWGTWPLLTEEEKTGLTFTEFTSRHITSDVILAALPDDFKAEILSPNLVDDYAYPVGVLGSYAYSLGQEVSLLTVMTEVDSSSDIFSGEKRNWLFFYTLYKDGADPKTPRSNCSVVTVTADNILPVLGLLYEEANPTALIPSVFDSTPDGYEMGDAVSLADTQFVLADDGRFGVGVLMAHCAYPNSRGTSRSRMDSIMFHGPLGVYSWTRKYGIKADGSCRLVLFGEAGLEIVPCVMPVEILTAPEEKIVADLQNEIRLFSRTDGGCVSLLNMFFGGPTPIASRLDVIAKNKDVHDFKYVVSDAHMAENAALVEYSKAVKADPLTADRSVLDAARLATSTAEEDLSTGYTELATAWATYNATVASQTYNTDSIDNLDSEQRPLADEALAQLPIYQSALLAKQNVLASALNNKRRANYKAIGVRPNITYAGNDLFLCVCERESAEEIVSGKDTFEVVAVYSGSPFTSWVKLPDAPDGGRLLHVRPLSVTAERTVLMGVYEKNPVSVDAPPTRHAAFLDTLNGNIDWRILGQIPVDYHNRDIWDISVFGDGEYVNMQNSYLSRPPSAPQYIHEDTVVEDYLEFKA